MSEKLVTIQVRESVAAELEEKFGKLPRSYANGTSIKILFGTYRVQGIEIVLACAKSMDKYGGVSRLQLEKLMLSAGYAERPVDAPLSILKNAGLIIEGNGMLFLPPSETDEGRLARQVSTRIDLIETLRNHFSAIGED